MATLKITNFVWLIVFPRDVLSTGTRLYATFDTDLRLSLEYIYLQFCRRAVVKNPVRRSSSSIAHRLIDSSKPTQVENLSSFSAPELQVPSPGRGRTRVDLRSNRSEEHTSELQSLMRISYAFFFLLSFSSFLF